MEAYITKDGKRLRLGYTTGSCAAAAAKAAVWMLLTCRRKETIRLLTPKGIQLELKVEKTQISDDFVRCAIRKDGGDDPDITTGAFVFARVTKTDIPGITIDVPDPNHIVIHGPDKQKVGQFAAEVREKRPPEPYKGKGIKYADEVIRRKEGKTGVKK